jgi:diphthamide synthase subunit DPH2
MGTVIVRGSSELVHCHVAGVTVYSSCCPRALGSVDLVCHVSDTD